MDMELMDQMAQGFSYINGKTFDLVFRTEEWSMSFDFGPEPKLEVSGRQPTSDEIAKLLFQAPHAVPQMLCAAFASLSTFRPPVRSPVSLAPPYVWSWRPGYFPS